MRSLAARLLPWALGLWAVGVQVHELPATVGAWATALCALVTAWPLSRWRPWALWLGFVGAALLLPVLGGHWPTPTGLARLADWLMVPAAAVAIRAVSPRALERIGVAAAVTVLVSVAVAACQHFGAWPALEVFAPLAGTRLGFERVYEPVPGDADRFMAGGLLLHRLKFANVTAAVCTLGAAAVAARVTRWRLHALATLVGLVGLAWFPHARAASVVGLGSVAVVLLTGTSSGRRPWAAVLGLAAASLLLGLGVPSLRARLASASEESALRRALLSTGLQAIRSEPLTGVGLGRFAPGRFAAPDAPESVKQHGGKAHDQFVTVAAEAGVPTALLLLAMLVAWIRRGALVLPLGALAVGGVALFVGLSLLHDPLVHPECSLALMLVLGAGAGLAGPETPVRQERPAPAS